MCNFKSYREKSISMDQKCGKTFKNILVVPLRFIQLLITYDFQFVLIPDNHE